MLVGNETHEAKHIVIATGSEAATLPFIEIDEEVVMTSEGALKIARIPERLVVIGGGVIGLEMGSVYARLGTKVTVVEYMDSITPGMDADVIRQFTKIMAKQGVEFVLGAAVEAVERDGETATVRWKTREGGEPGEIEVDAVLVATGRKPYHGWAGVERARRDDHEGRPGRDRRAVADLGRGDPGDRRRGGGADAGAQGRG